MVGADAIQNVRAKGLCWHTMLISPLFDLDEAGKSAWCREHGVFPAELDKWRLSATTALAEPEDVRASPQATRADKKRIKELERELHRKDKALAETAALLVLSKKVAAIFNKGEGE